MMKGFAVIPAGLPALPETDLPAALLGQFWLNPVGEEDAALFMGMSLGEMRADREREGGLPHRKSEAGVSYVRADLWRHLQEHDTP